MKTPPAYYLCLILLVCDIVFLSLQYLHDFIWLQPIALCFASIYCVCYLRLITARNVPFMNLRSIVLPFLCFKLFAFVLLAFIVWDPASIDLGDASAYHIPRALSIDNPVEYLFLDYGDYNGRLTHVFLWAVIFLCRLLGVSPSEYKIACIYYFLNTILVVASAIIVYSFIKRFYANQLAIRSSVTLLCSPFVLGYSLLPQKESLFMFLSVLAFCSISSIPSNRSSVFLFLTATLAATLERFYVLPFLILSLFLEKLYLLRRSRRFLLFFLFILIPLLIALSVKVLSFLSLESAQFMMSNSLDSNVGSESYSFGSTGIVGNFLKVSFGPAGLPRFINNFMLHSDAGGGFIYVSSLILTQLLVPLCLFVSLTNIKSPGSIVLLGLYAYLMLTVPHVYVFKLLEIYVLLAVYPPLSTGIGDCLVMLSRGRISFRGFKSKV
jgi:hypothetical protein